MNVDVSGFLSRFDVLVSSKDMSILNELLADDVVMAPPPHWTKVEGKPRVAAVLGAVFGSIEDFAYHRRWVDGLDIALEFTGNIGDRQLQGIDLITLDAEGKIRKVDVLMRPLSGIAALGDAVALRLGVK